MFQTDCVGTLGIKQGLLINMTIDSTDPLFHCQRNQYTHKRSSHITKMRRRVHTALVSLDSSKRIDYNLSSLGSCMVAFRDFASNPQMGHERSQRHELK